MGKGKSRTEDSGRSGKKNGGSGRGPVCAGFLQGNITEFPEGDILRDPMWHPLRGIRHDPSNLHGMRDMDFPINLSQNFLKAASEQPAFE